MDDDRAEQRQALEKFAGNPGGGHAVPPSQVPALHQGNSSPELIVGAQPVAVRRDEAQILQKLAAVAAAAGSDWFYRFPVKSASGGQSWIEGPSIKLANDVARIFGNNANQIRVIDIGDAWIFYARFTDIETGFSMERAYQQRKSQTTLRTKDSARAEDLLFQVGQSKAIRNCIVNSLQLYTDYAYEQAKNSLVEKIGKALESWRQRVIEGLQRMPVEVARAERVVGRAAKDWLAPDVARIVSMMHSVRDGMASADEVFPPLGPPPAGEPKATEKPPEPSDPQPPIEFDPETGEVPPPPRAERYREAQPAEAPAAPAAVEIAAAYARGQQQAREGKPRKALPGEYRDAAHQREAAAWYAGFDGKPLPAAAPNATEERDP